MRRGVVALLVTGVVQQLLAKSGPPLGELLIRNPFTELPTELLIELGRVEDSSRSTNGAGGILTRAIPMKNAHSFFFLNNEISQSRNENTFFSR